MFRRLKLFVQSVKAVRAARAGGDIDAEVDKLLRQAGFEGSSGPGSDLDNAAQDLLLDPPFEALYPDAPHLTAAHVALIRRMRLSWNGVESGAPQCEPSQSFTGGMAQALIRAELGDVDDEAVAEFMVSLAPAMGVFMQHARLAPGTYTLGNMTPELLAQAKAGLEGADALFAIAPGMRFTVEADDLTLAAQAQWQWPDEEDMYAAFDAGDIAGPTVDGKRPYGDMSYIDLDIHRILGWPVEARTEDGNIAISDAQQAMATRLHFRQLGTLQAFVQHADIAPEHLQ